MRRIAAEDRQRRAPRVTHEDCYHVLGLAKGASAREIHRAYKRQVLRHHPDRTGNDPASRAAFCRITEAYFILRRHDPSEPVARCHRCGRDEPLYRSLTGHRMCAACLLNRRRRLLPLPRMETIRCLAAIAFTATALLFVLGALLRGDGFLGVTAVALSLSTLLALSINVLSADVIE